MLLDQKTHPPPAHLHGQLEDGDEGLGVLGLAGFPSGRHRTVRPRIRLQLVALPAPSADIQAGLELLLQPDHPNTPPPPHPLHHHQALLPPSLSLPLNSQESGSPVLLAAGSWSTPDLERRVG